MAEADAHTQRAGRSAPVRVLVVMGVSGSGKSTVGRLLAQRLACPFVDADDYHPAANRAKMSAGVALTDADRRPWLAALRELVRDALDANRPLVLACSALRQEYREVLAVDPARVWFVYLKGTPDQIAERLRARSGHFMPPGLLPSQFAALEEPSGAIVVRISLPPAAIVDAIMQSLASGEA